MSASGVVGHMPYGLAVGVGAVLVVLAGLVAGIAFPGHSPWARLVVVCLAVGGFASVVGVGAGPAVVTAGIGWLVFGGFLVNRFGELTWNGDASVWQLGSFAAAAGLGLVVQRVRVYLMAGINERGLADAPSPVRWSEADDACGHGGPDRRVW